VSRIWGDRLDAFGARDDGLGLAEAAWLAARMIGLRDGLRALPEPDWDPDAATEEVAPPTVIDDR
jgi:hypothetical protein